MCVFVCTLYWGGFAVICFFAMFYGCKSLFFCHVLWVQKFILGAIVLRAMLWVYLGIVYIIIGMDFFVYIVYIIIGMDFFKHKQRHRPSGNMWVALKRAVCFSPDKDCYSAGFELAALTAAISALMVAISWRCSSICLVWAIRSSSRDGVGGGAAFGMSSPFSVISVMRASRVDSVSG